MFVLLVDKFLHLYCSLNLEQSQSLGALLKPGFLIISHLSNDEFDIPFVCNAFLDQKVKKAIFHKEFRSFSIKKRDDPSPLRSFHFLSVHINCNIFLVRTSRLVWYRHFSLGLAWGLAWGLPTSYPPRLQIADKIS